MSQQADIANPVRPAVYRVLCHVALAAIMVVGAQGNRPLVYLAAVFVGGLTLSRGWGPNTFLFFFSFTQFGFGPVVYGGGQAAPGMQPTDVLLGIAVLAYVSGSYRLAALVRGIVPADPRLAAKVASSQKRPESGLTPEEIVLFVLSLPLWFGLGAFVTSGMIALEQRAGLTRTVERMLIAIWVLALVLALARLVFRYWGWKQMSPTAATMLLQSVLWNETRREQRRIERWCAWRLGQAKKGPTP